MKNYCIITLAIALILAGLSCTKDQAFNDISELKAEQEVTIKATIASADPDTKTVRQSNGAVFWAPKDSISLFYGSGDNGGNKFTAVCTEPSAVSNFTGTIGVITGGGEITMDQIYFWGVYPYSSTTSCSSGSIYYDLPSRQVSAAGSFSNGQFPTMGRSHELQISFYNICGGIRFTVANENIMSVTFRNVDGGSIAGRLCVTPDSNGLPVVSSISNGSDTIEVTPEDGNAFIPGVDYYVVIPPVTMSSGLEVTYKTLTTKATKTFTSSISISRSVFSGLTAQDNGLTFELRDDAYVPFEDANFKAYCVENFDTDGDGEISFKEADDVIEINVCTDNISSLSGIDYFLNITSISAQGSGAIYISDQVSAGSGNTDGFNRQVPPGMYAKGQLQEAYFYDLKNLNYINLRNNVLEDLQIDNCPSLSYVNSDFNRLSSCDFSGCQNLESLELSYGYIEEINVSNNLALKCICVDGNRLEILDINNNRSLTNLACSSNQLTCLDVTNNLKLINFSCDNNYLEDLNVNNNTALVYLSCSYNQLTNLNVSYNTALARLYCAGNQLTSLDVSRQQDLDTLYCYSNQLTSLDVSKNTALTLLNCSSMTTLETLYIAQSQSIPNITSNRSTSHIPSATEIVIAGVPQAVDLGLSVKWASINLGADTPWESGGYYSWGDTTPKSASECNYANYKYAENNGGWKFTKYCINSNRGTVDNKTRLELADDAAYAELGGNWRIPTKDDWNELVANCTFTYTTMNGIPGYEVRSNKTGYTSNYIFMPLAGQYYSSSHYYEDNMGVYWSSDLVTNDDTGGYVMEVIAPNSSYYWGHLDWHSGPRESGCTVRPVCN